MDSIDFNLFVKESDIPICNFTEDWARLFAGEKINFDVMTPPIRISLDLIRVGPSRVLSSRLSNNKFRDSREDEEILRNLAQLTEDNTRLRRALTVQINQRAYFQEEYRRAQKRCAQQMIDSYKFNDQIAELQRSLKELHLLIETHEKTNQSLQSQLADAYSQPQEGNDGALVQKLRITINNLSDQLEAERTLHKQTFLELDELKEQYGKLQKSTEAQLHEMNERMTERTQACSTRIRILQDQLKLYRK